MPIGHDTHNLDENVDNEMTGRSDRWKNAIFDIQYGKNLGCHNHFGELNVKLMYMTVFSLLWILFGALTFAALEEKDMQKYQKGSHDFESMVTTIRALSLNGTIPLANFTRRQLTHAANFMDANKPAAIQWGPTGGFFFSVLSMTTIGYGRFLTPKTMGCRLFVIPYTLVGIPLLAILYTAWAKKWMKWLKSGIRKIQGDKAARWQTTLIAFGIFLIMMLGVGPAIFISYEDWEYYEAVYFVWCSVSTIGYGDYVPETPEGQVIGIASCRSASVCARSCSLPSSRGSKISSFTSTTTQTRTSLPPTNTKRMRSRPPS